MKYLQTQAGTFLTGTEIADAVQSYSFALHGEHQTALVEVPFLQSGQTRRATFTVGWLADIATISAPTQASELVEADTVIGLYDRAAQVGPRMALPFSYAELDSLTWFDMDT